MTIDFLHTPLLNQIICYVKSPLEPFHMPGHAGGRGIHPEIKSLLGCNTFKADLTELDKLDNLSNPHGVIKQTQEKISTIFNTQASYLLVNGSTAGLQAAILSCLKDNDRVLVARNCHRAVISSIILSGAEPIFFMPEWLNQWSIAGKINPEKLDSALEYYQDIQAIVITSPTYEGITSDIGTISAICKKYGIYLIVDEAHGGHFKYSNKFPHSAVDAGADAVIQSFHKSCGSLSQSSILHIPQFSMIDCALLEENLKLLQTTSPSYLLMASLDAASSYLYSEEGKAILEEAYNKSIKLRSRLKSIPNLKVLEISQQDDLDPTRVLISFENLSGETFATILENEFNIGIESLNKKGVLLFINIGNTDNQIDILCQSLEKISLRAFSEKTINQPAPELPELAILPRQAYFGKSETVHFSHAIGRINRFPIVCCPPGICVLVPGERIKREHLRYFKPEDKIEVLV